MIEETAIETPFYRGHFTSRRYASAVYAVVVCPSVRPSVTRRCRITQTTPYNSL